MNRRWLIILIVAAAALLLASDPALAQCPMCRQAVADSKEGQSLAKGLNLAILVLLIPPVAIFAGIFGVIYKYKDAQGDKDSD
ncbi:MAG TPA: hypothetical protein VJQ56_12885 [Blastocatellia bacterium]|nr:hypothetical protein [Blastocatellia bacterium]